MITEEQLREAMKAAGDVIVADFPMAYEQPEHQFSPQFERKIERLARRLGRKPFHSVLQKVACIALVIALLSGIWQTIGTDGQAAVIGWFKEKYETFFHYFYEGESNGPVSDAEYELGWVPDGYEFLTRNEFDGLVTTLYKNENGQFLKFSYDISPGTGVMYQVNEQYTVETVSIFKLSAEVHISTDGSVGNDIVWENDEHILFVITAYESKDNLVKIAENIKLIK